MTQVEVQKCKKWNTLHKKSKDYIQPKSGEKICKTKKYKTANQNKLKSKAK